MNDYKLLLSSGHSSYELRHQTFQLPKIKHEYAKCMFSGVAKDMCMGRAQGGAQHIYGGGAQINCTKMVLAGDIYIHGRIEGGQRGLAPSKID